MCYLKLHKYFVLGFPLHVNFLVATESYMEKMYYDVDTPSPLVHSILRDWVRRYIYRVQRVGTQYAKETVVSYADINFYLKKGSVPVFIKKNNKRNIQSQNVKAYVCKNECTCACDKHMETQNMVVVFC